MIVDTSALATIALREPEADRMSAAIAGSPVRTMSAVNWLEALTVLESRLGPGGVSIARQLLAEFGIELLNFDSSQMEAAHRAY